MIETMKLSNQQKADFVRDGYVHIPNVIPSELVNRAMHGINHSIGEGIHSEDVLSMRSTSYCRELQADPVVLDLLHQSPAWLLAESAIGESRIKNAVSGQIALRFPTHEENQTSLPWPHLDGMHTPDNGVPKGVIRNFTALVGIALSDVPAPFSGNLSLWPGSHKSYEEYFREHTPQSLLEGMPKVPLPEPKQLLAKAGDVMLVHYQVAHGAAINVSPHVRYAIYFRLKHVDHDKDPWGAMTNIWRDWEGLRDHT